MGQCRGERAREMFVEGSQGRQFHGSKKKEEEEGWEESLRGKGREEVAQRKFQRVSVM